MKPVELALYTLAVAGVAGVAYAIGRAQGPTAPLVATPAAPAPGVNPVSITTLALANGVSTQAVSLPVGSTLDIYPPADSVSKLLSYTLSGANNQAAPSAAGPISFTVNGSSSVVVSWQNAQGVGESTTVNFTAT